MTLTRPRLMASALCLLLVLMAAYLVVVSRRSSPVLMSRSEPLSISSDHDLVTNYEPPVPMPASPPGIAPSSPPLATVRQTGPSVNPTAAPGVAFNYRYAFRLPAVRLAEVQERHAEMCERLTVAHCRITGMLYRVVNDRDIEAMLALKLDPAAARLFGREATGLVIQSEGMMTESEISGTDANAAIREAGPEIATMQAELAQIETMLRARNLPDADRSQREYNAQQLRARIRAAIDSRDSLQQSLATTPMLFRYGSGDLVPGFGPPETLAQSLHSSIEAFLDVASMVLRLLLALLPWALTTGLLAWIGIRMRRRWFSPAPSLPI